MSVKLLLLGFFFQVQAQSGYPYWQPSLGCTQSASATSTLTCKAGTVISNITYVAFGNFSGSASTLCNNPPTSIKPGVCQASNLFPTVFPTLASLCMNKQSCVLPKALFNTTDPICSQSVLPYSSRIFVVVVQCAYGGSCKFLLI